MKSTRLIALFISLFLMVGIAYGKANASPACNLTTGQVEVEDGRIEYVRTGYGPSLLLLHGFFAQKEQWTSLACSLAAAGYTAIAPDLPGYGQSVDFPLEDYQLERQVGLLHQFMQALGLKSYDLAGSSMGGTIAALFTRRYPREVMSLAFIGSPLGIIEWGSGVKEAIVRGINPFIPIDGKQFDLEMSLLFFNPPAIAQNVKEALIKEYVDRNRHYQQVWDIVNLYDTMFHDGRWGGKPTLIIWGKDDRIFAEEGAALLKRRIPRSRVFKLPNAGHLLLMENADTAAALYLQFLRHQRH